MPLKTLPPLFPLDTFLEPAALTMCTNDDLNSHIDMVYRQLCWIDLNINTLHGIEKMHDKAQKPTGSSKKGSVYTGLILVTQA